MFYISGLSPDQPLETLFPNSEHSIYAQNFPTKRFASRENYGMFATGAYQPVIAYRLGGILI
ncbi:MAG: hypothetical protein LPK02_14990 [Rhodobacterales bacterium]|nr:hypothetical protein [Rhodobacterales bacterium]